MKIVVFTYNDPFAGKHGGGTRLLKMVEYFSNYGNVIVIIPTFDEKKPSAMKIGNTTFYYVRMSLLLRIVNFGVLKLTRWFEKPLKIPPAFLHN